MEKLDCGELVILGVFLLLSVLAIGTATYFDNESRAARLEAREGK